MLRIAPLFALAFCLAVGSSVLAQSTGSLQLPTLVEPVLPDAEHVERPPLESGAAEDVETETGEIQPQRLTDEIIRSNWPTHSIREIDISLAETGRVPNDRSELLDGFGRVGPIVASQKLFAWEAPGIRYQPLYFEDVTLERYGQTMPAYRQGIRSAFHFAKSFAGLSFQMLETPPKGCEYPLGYCRPGACVPQTTQRHFFGALSLR